jgi:hypothetical protein
MLRYMTHYPDGDGGGNAGGGDGGGNGEGGTAAEAGRTFTQEEVEKIIGDRLGRERTKYADYDELKARSDQLAAIEEAGQSDVERVTGERDKLAERIGPLEAENLRLNVALEKGLPKSLAVRLQGSTKEEVEADAEELVKLVGSGERGSSEQTEREATLDGGSRGASIEAEGIDGMIRHAAGRA